VQWGTWSVSVGIPGYSTIVIEFDPFGRAIDPISAWDAEVRNVSVIESVPVWDPLECLLILEDAILERLNLLRKLAILDCGVGLLIGNCGEQSVCNSAEELSIDVRVCSEGGLGGSW